MADQYEYWEEKYISEARSLINDLDEINNHLSNNRLFLLDKSDEISFHEMLLCHMKSNSSWLVAFLDDIDSNLNQFIASIGEIIPSIENYYSENPYCSNSKIQSYFINAIDNLKSFVRQFENKKQVLREEKFLQIQVIEKISSIPYAYDEAFSSFYNKLNTIYSLVLKTKETLSDLSIALDDVSNVMETDLKARMSPPVRSLYDEIFI